MNKIKSFWKKGDSYIFLTGGGLIFSLLMVVFMVAVILVKGFSAFWPHEVAEIKMNDGSIYIGEVYDSEILTIEDENQKTIKEHQTNIKIGNRDIYGQDFVWIKDKNILETKTPPNAIVFERWEYGNFYGFLKSVIFNNNTYENNDVEIWEMLQKAFDKSVENIKEKKEIEEELNELITPLSELQRVISLKKINAPNQVLEIENLQKQADELEKNIYSQKVILTEKIQKLIIENQTNYLILQTAEGNLVNLPLEKVFRFYKPNDMNLLQKIGFYVEKLGEFIFGEPRESNTEGGVFPAIFGTVLMVLLMSIAVVPFGVLAALYLNEYAKQGPVTRFIRLAIANLAGVPSIVYGIFGLGFFIYTLGGSIDQLLFSDKLPEPTFGTGGILWASLTLALLTLPVVVVATEEGILAVPKANKDGALALGSTKWQMIKKIVLPNAMPGILTGVILAISRGAGEVAPLMITGVVKLAPSLPLDGSFPFLHLDRKFMHLGFHIYDVGFQSPNVEAALPMVYTTALLLIIIVIALNLTAIFLRYSLRKKFKTSAF